MSRWGKHQDFADQPELAFRKIGKKMTLEGGGGGGGGAVYIPKFAPGFNPTVNPTAPTAPTRPTAPSQFTGHGSLSGMAQPQINPYQGFQSPFNQYQGFQQPFNQYQGFQQPFNQYQRFQQPFSPYYAPQQSYVNPYAQYNMDMLNQSAQQYNAYGPQMLQYGRDRAAFGQQYNRYRSDVNAYNRQAQDYRNAYGTDHVGYQSPNDLVAVSQDTLLSSPRGVEVSSPYVPPGIMGKGAR